MRYALYAPVMSVFLLLAGSDARATDQGITGKKLLLKSTKLVVLSKHPTLSIMGSDPVGGADSSITFTLNGGSPLTFSLPKTLWSTDGSVTLFKYKNRCAGRAVDGEDRQGQGWLAQSGR